MNFGVAIDSHNTVEFTVLFRPSATGQASRSEKAQIENHESSGEHQEPKMNKMNWKISILRNRSPDQNHHERVNDQTQPCQSI